MGRKAYFKEGKEVVKPLSLIYKGVTYIPPTDDVILLAGYEIKDVEDVVEEEVPIPYNERVSSFIRSRYSIDDELAILRQRDVKPEEFEEYNRYCEECKQLARENP